MLQILILSVKSQLDDSYSVSGRMKSLIHISTIFRRHGIHTSRALFMLSFIPIVISLALDLYSVK